MPSGSRRMTSGLPAPSGRHAGDELCPHYDNHDRVFGKPAHTAAGRDSMHNDALHRLKHASMTSLDCVSVFAISLLNRVVKTIADPANSISNGVFHRNVATRFRGRQHRFAIVCAVFRNPIFETLPELVNKFCTIAHAADLAVLAGHDHHGRFARQVALQNADGRASSIGGP